MIAGYTAALSLSRPRSAVSAEAEVIRSGAHVVVENVQRSVALFGPKAALISELWILSEECREPNWDGYGAAAARPEAVRRAQELIESLPNDVPLPECSVEPDGCVSLDWIPGAHRTLTLSVGESDRIPYAWIDGSDRGHAVATVVGGQLPSRILAEIRRFTGHDASLRAA